MLNTARGFAHFLLGAITALCPILVQATVTVQSISGVSNWVKEGSSIIVYGGFAGGEGAECIANGDGTCNNCVLGAGLAACNEKRSMLGSEITITVSSDSDESGPIILTTSDSSTKIGNNGDTISKGQTGSLKVTWSTLCATAFPNAGNSCVTTEYPSSSAASLIIGVDGNTDSKLSSGEGDTIIFRVHMPYNADTIALCSDTGATFTDGVCGFTVYPGDRKVFIEDLEPTSTFPSAGSIQFSAARFFFSTTGFTYGAEGPNPGSNFGYHDIPIVTEDDNYFLSNKSIDDLENNSYYFFRISMLDQANNVSFITSDAAISLACGGGNPADLKADEASDLACPFIARPDEVVGLLTKDLNCFIATAAYGTSMDHHLDIFRQFRQKILLPHELGRQFVRYYYRWGPYAARWIHQHSWTREIVQILLWPFWLLAFMTLQFGILPVLMFALVFAFGLGTLPFWYRRSL